jgi:hypothetical protein
MRLLRGCIISSEHFHTHQPFQYVSVPDPFVPAVYRLLAELGEASSGAEMDPVELSPDFGIDGWTEEKLRRLAAGDTNTTQLVGEILSILAEAPDEALTLDELAQRTGHPYSQVRMLWTSASRHFARHYGTDRSPVSKKAGDQFTPPRDNVVYYFLTADQAAMWARVRDE